MNNIKTEKTIILQEGIFESWLKDGFTFALMFLMFWLNHTYTDGSWVIDLTITLFIFLILVGRLSRSRVEMTIEETIKYLQGLKK